MYRRVGKYIYVQESGKDIIFVREIVNNIYLCTYRIMGVISISVQESGNDIYLCTGWWA